MIFLRKEHKDLTPVTVSVWAGGGGGTRHVFCAAHPFSHDAQKPNFGLPVRQNYEFAL
jgi:hypothetical protein